MSKKDEFSLQSLENIRRQLSKLDEPLEPLFFEMIQLSDILEFSDTERDWFAHEIRGYSNVDKIPAFRHVSILLKLSTWEWLKYRGNYGRWKMGDLVSQLHVQGVHRTRVIHFSCADLEEPSDIPVRTKEEFEVPQRYESDKGKVELELVGKITQSLKKTILRARRLRLQSIVMKYYIRLRFEMGGQELTQRVINSLLDSLSLVDDALLRMVSDAIQKQERSTTPNEWISSLHDLREIIRTFSGLILQEFMIPDGLEEPEHFATNTKIRFVHDWIVEKSNESSMISKGTEADTILTRFERLTNESADLIDLVNKTYHASHLSDINGRTVDRLTLQVITWMSDVLDLLKQFDALPDVENS